MQTLQLAEHLIDLEKQLHSTGARHSVEALSCLIADDFIEYGASGDCFGKQEVLKWLPLEQNVEITAFDFQCRLLADDVAQVTYRSVRKLAQASDRYTLRSSIWKKTGRHWQMIFHQGTLSSSF
ncbi:DUF4440 domain-containing protein [Spartinivicinus poritis]|uniref:DUF4440 domain-containing protein n=1 Tax=Spartinivicinus poritis TaxID=2994640 RepID=A0ABT5U3N0_9GAMM|nr:DUF4440 domain-containing protein [Spartinivicinus sp. A2-2]MDE1460973.1 DUF4440 domain-containing protein [Spartinivicinus sp. A2-2]